MSIPTKGIQSESFPKVARTPLLEFPDVIIHYVLVDDFVGMGGTLANFRGLSKRKVAGLLPQ